MFELVENHGSLIDWAFSVYVQLLEPALAIALVFGFSNLLVSTFLRVVFGGPLKFGGRS